MRSVLLVVVFVVAALVAPATANAAGTLTVTVTRGGNRHERRRPHQLRRGQH
jgi:hypothetical protein